MLNYHTKAEAGVGIRWNRRSFRLLKGLDQHNFVWKPITEHSVFVFTSDVVGDNKHHAVDYDGDPLQPELPGKRHVHLQADLLDNQVQPHPLGQGHQCYVQLWRDWSWANQLQLRHDGLWIDQHSADSGLNIGLPDYQHWLNGSDTFCFLVDPMLSKVRISVFMV